mmetsp:Transcript_17359/g.21224  ORF Transcript_17359/g.21224 Transcript_17359/m.21224 type:complete len:254 (-) Transcript_17359:268-1029(-)
MKLAITAALLGSAVAFQAPVQQKVSTVLNAKFDQPSKALPYKGGTGAPDTLDGTLPGDVGFDPVGFSTGDIASLFDRKNTGDSMSNLYWLREAEVTHGRIAQLAVLGFIWPALAGTFPGNDFSGGADAYSFVNPTEALTHVPSIAIAQIVGAMSLVEFRRVQLISQQGSSRVPGDLGLGQFGTINPFKLNYSEEEYFEKEVQEIKHCRLAMLGAAGLWLQACNSGTDIVSQLGASLTSPEYVSKAGYFLPEGI